MASCQKCSEPPVTYIRTSGQHLCKEHFIHSFEKRAKRELADQGKLPEGIVAVALSGGKDSVACLHFLQKIAALNPKIELAAISIDEGIGGYRESALDICKDVTQAMGIRWEVATIKDLAGYTIDDYAAGRNDDTNVERPSCGPCGVFRRMGLNDKAKEIGAAAIATGHNLDDMAQTVLMNVLNGDVDRLARLAPHTVTQPGMVRRIIPFRTIPEKEVLLYALLEGLPLHHEAECPYAERAHRFAMRDTLLDLEQRNPGTRHSLIAFQDKLKPYLGDAGVVGTCPECGGPTSGDVCKACQLSAQPS